MELDNDTKEMVKVGIRSGIFSICLAAIRALLVTDENFRTTLKVWLAGTIAGTVAGVICHFLDLGKTTTTVSIIILAPFISSVWPILEKAAKNFTKRKTKEIENGDV